jgi:hypothetical protein
MDRRRPSQQHDRVLYNWKRLVLSALNPRSARPGGAGLPSSVPSSLDRENIDTILDVANDVEFADANVARIRMYPSLFLSRFLSSFLGLSEHRLPLSMSIWAKGSIFSSILSWSLACLTFLSFIWCCFHSLRFCMGKASVHHNIEPITFYSHSLTSLANFTCFSEMSVVYGASALRFFLLSDQYLTWLPVGSKTYVSFISGILHKFLSPPNGKISKHISPRSFSLGFLLFACLWWLAWFWIVCVRWC